jgi:UDP-GlcNAc:undecaprenyl-phosphate/decaprenyl-phosphate GlcNAc-1-phosphate transferase
MSRSLAVLGGSFLTSVVATRVAGATARKRGIVDHPGPLKPQATPVPYLGGIGVLAGTSVGVAATRPVLLLPLGLAAALGTADDVSGLSPGVRVAGQLAIGALCAATAKTSLPDPIGPAAVVGATFVLMNGVNLIDGLDGLAGGVAAAGGGAFALMLQGGASQIAGAFALGCAGFLVYNRPPASIYLGDGGAYVIGTSLALLLASAWSPGERAQVNLASLLLVAIPAAEVTFALVRRRRSGRSVVEGDRGHPYDRLVSRGWTARRAAACYVTTAAALGGVAVLVSKGRSASLPAAAVAAVAAVMIGGGTATQMLQPSAEESNTEEAS